jgi:salicylate biosynthesis isochorismate synthase/menaquinone-specific isochorismate synthase
VSEARRTADGRSAAPEGDIARGCERWVEALDGPGAASIADNVERALSRSRRAGVETLACCTVPVGPEVDPSAVAVASRRAEEPWFCFEQPARGGAAVAALGEVTRLAASGPRRFRSIAEQWRQLTREARCVTIDAPGQAQSTVGGGEAPLAVGGFSFAVDGGSSPGWSGFEPASLSVPELALVRPAGGSTRMTLSCAVAPDDTAEEVLERMHRRLATLAQRPLPLLDPSPAGEHRVVSAMPPEHFEAAVGRATELIGAGEIDKIVLAREVQVHAPRPHDPGAILGALRGAFPSCFVYCLGRPGATFLGASPELLVRREGQRLSTIALAGSARRSADPAVDAHIGEQLLRSSSYREEHEIVVRRIEKDLRSLALWVTSAPEPELVKVANIQHLGTPIRAQLANPRDAVELLQALHPTPAVGGEPARLALELIPALEGLDRGWYAGPVGWIDAMGDGEFCVALRCALLRGAVAHCYAGNGIVRDSEPAAELAETEVKLAALLPLLAG